METETPSIQTDDQSSRRRHAIIALCVQSIALLTMAIFSIYVLSITVPISPMDFGRSFTTAIAFFSAILGIIPFGLAYSIFSGNARKKLLRNWAGLCICYGLFLILIISRSIGDLTLSLIWFPTLNILLTIFPACIILRFTGLYDEKREYHK